MGKSGNPFHIGDIKTKPYLIDLTKLRLLIHSDHLNQSANNPP
jgi:hypothetical protein